LLKYNQEHMMLFLLLQHLFLT